MLFLLDQPKSIHWTSMREKPKAAILALDLASSFGKLPIMYMWLHEYFQVIVILKTKYFGKNFIYSS